MAAHRLSVCLGLGALGLSIKAALDGRSCRSRGAPGSVDLGGAVNDVCEPLQAVEPVGFLGSILLRFDDQYTISRDSGVGGR